ncbi:MAG TPA: calcium/sodium antiporter, partial [Methylophaga sp.]|nr:calcium/sodium antiporter [Methylophaga sp.]
PILLFIFGFGIGRQGRINRLEGGFFMLAFVSYTAYLISTIVT